MNQSPFLGLVQNTALLLSIALLFDLVLRRTKSDYFKLWQIPVGVLLGGIGITLMLTPWVLIPGIIFDTRSILLGISGLFFGSIPTLIAIAITAVFRVYQGGSATWVGVSVIFASGMIGIIWRKLRRRSLESLKGWELYLFGLLIHLVMLACMFILPLETAKKVLADISLPVITIYPVGTVLLGSLMTNRLRRERISSELYESEVKLSNYANDLQKSEEQYRLLTENIKDVVWILDTETMRFRYVSPSVERLRGYTSEEIIREPIDHALTNEASENLKSLIRSRVEAFLTGEVSPDHFYADDVEQPCKDGSNVWTEAVTTYYINPENGRVEVRGVSRDISARKKVEGALLASEERMARILETVPDGIVMVAASGQITFANPEAEKILGLSVSGVTERVYNDPAWKITTVDGDYFPENQLPFFLVKQTNAPVSGIEQVIEHPDGQQTTLSINAVPLHDGLNNFIGMIATLTNITERKKAEKQVLAVQTELKELLNISDQSRLALLSVLEDQKKVEDKIRLLNIDLEQRVLDRTAQLEAANQELEAFSYSVSHDLRAPLRALDGFSSALMMDYKDQLNDQGVHYLNRIKDASKRMGQLIEDLLNLSRVTRQDFSRTKVNLSEMVNTICGELQERESNRKIKLEIEEGIFVMADFKLIKIAMENLLQNAFKFTGKLDQAIIRFGVKKSDNKKIYFISDNGVGFNMAYAEKLFSPFQRLHGMNEFPGTGIGLVTVQRIITRHGGRIWPEAIENQGVTFYFTMGGING